MSLRRRLLVFVTTLGVAAATIPVLVGSANTTEIHAFGGGLYAPYWSPTPANATEGGSITFDNASGYNHGIIWKSVPVTPQCEEGAGQVPVGTGKWSTSWKGSCTFSQAGTYSFYCSYHGEAMSGSITVKAPSAPKARTGEATGLSQTAATLNGTLSPEGEALKYEFEYGTASVSEHKTIPASVAGDFAEHAVSEALTNLTPNTEYHFKLIATYGTSGKSEGTENVFKTLPPAELPKATTGKVSGLMETQATLEGTVNPGWETTKYFFEYGTTIGYGQKTETKSLSASGSNQPVTLLLTKLASGTEYHYRLVAENGQGRNEGLDGAFKTVSPPPPPPPSKEPPTPTPTPAPGPIAPEPEIAPLVPPFVQGTLKLTAPRHGSSVHGSLDVASSGAGGRLEIDLIAKSASLANVRHRKPASMVVGRLVRSSVPGGKVSFSVGLNAKAKSALRRHHKLALTVQIVLTPKSGPAVTVARNVTLKS
jgi:plastocyanin